jgi:hypothetical protein
MASFFRFHRGELNGWYINRLLTFLNKYSLLQGLLDELVYHANFQWILPEQALIGETGIRESDMIRLIEIGGLFSERIYARTTMGSIWFTQSHVVNGTERSERGLLDTWLQSFRFIRVEQDDYSDEIQTQASEDLRSTYKESGAELLGYIYEDEDLFDSAGRINPEAIHTEPPTDKAYNEWYGTKYLWYEQGYLGNTPLPADVAKLLFESLQYIRRHGVSVTTLVQITQDLGEGFIYDLDISPEAWWYNLYYKLDDNAVVINRDTRYNAWLYVMQRKFKDFVPRLYVNPDEGE